MTLSNNYRALLCAMYFSKTYKVILIHIKQNIKISKVKIKIEYKKSVKKKSYV